MEPDPPEDAAARAAVAGVQAPPGAPCVPLGLRPPLRPGDRDDVSVAAQPCERGLPGRLAMCAADFSELADQRRRGPQVRGLEQILLRSNAVLRPLAVVVLAGEDTFADRAPGEDRDALQFAVGEDLGFDLPLEHVVPYLVRHNVRPREMGSRLREIAGREVAHPDVPDPPGPVEGLESLHRLPQGDLTPRIRPMHLIEVDLPDSEALQTGGTRFLHVVRPQMPAPDFRRDEDAVPADVPNRSRHDALGMAVAVRLRGVHEVDPKP